MSLDYLSLYGTSFQTKIITNLITHKEFLSQIIDILSPDYFDSDANKYIVGIIIDYFKEYREIPTYEVFKVKLQDIRDDILKSTVTTAYREAMQSTGSTDLEYVRNEFLNFCKNKKMKEVIIQSVELVKSGDYEAISKLMNDALRSGTDRDLGLNYSIDIEKRYNEDDRKNLINTEWPPINEILDGGLGAGDLGVLVGGPGVGKCVGPNTKIEIEYIEVGIEDTNGNIKWYKPWEKVEINGEILFAYEMLGASGNGKI